MAYSKIEISFGLVPDPGTFLTITETTSNTVFHEVFQEERLAAGQVAIPIFSEADGLHPDRYFGHISTNYKNAVNNDHNLSGLFTITSVIGPINSGTGSVTIEANFPGANFEVNGSDVGASITILNEIPENTFSITGVNLEASNVDVCQNVKISVTTDLSASKILSPVIVEGINTNLIVFDFLRGGNITVLVEDATGNQASKLVALPGLLSVANFSILVNNSPNGSTAIISKINSNGLNILYSLDNTNFQTSNIFPGLDVGSYILYIKDQFGCLKTISFGVIESGVYSPFFYISKSNSLRFAQRVSFLTNYKTDENTLSCEALVKMPYKEIQQFESADVITTQFKSNFTTNEVAVVGPTGVETSIQVSKKSNNIGLKSKMDARKYNISAGKTGIYFLSGNVYDFDSGNLTGVYTLSGSLPEWGVVGNYIQIGAAWFEIKEVVFDEEKNADVLVIVNDYDGPVANIIAGSKFNRENYNVYEFSIDMANFEDQKISVIIESSDPNFAALKHESEVILVKEKHEDTLEIKYKNEDNTDVFYSTGIEHVIRVPFTIIKGKDEGDSETYKTDTTAILLDAYIYESEEFVFEPVTKEIWRKLKQALSHSSIFVGGVGYVRNGDFSTEGPLNDSNLYVLSATMIKTGNIYNTNSDAVNVEIVEDSVFIPGLIATEIGGFISY